MPDKKHETGIFLPNSKLTAASLARNHAVMASKHGSLVAPRLQSLFLALAFASSAHAQEATAGAKAAPTTVAPPSTSGGPNQPVGSTEIQYVVQDGALYGVAANGRQRIAVEGEATAVQRFGSQLYVGFGSRGVIVYELTQPLNPAILRQIPVLSGKVTGFHVVDGQVWAVVESRSAVPLNEISQGPMAPGASSAVAPTASPSPAVPVQPRSEASVYIGILRATPGTVEIAMGSDRGARVGDRFVILRSSTADTGEWEGFQGEEQIAVAEVTAVKQTSSLAQVSRSAIVRDTDRARPAKPDETESNVLPPRVPRVGEVSVVLRPLVNIGTPLGAAVLADIAMTYWGSAYFAGLRIEPLGLGTTKYGSIVATAALAEGGYDGRAFAVGLGVGLAAVNGDLDHMLSVFQSTAADESGSGSTTQISRPVTHTAFAMSQVARLGARDGLNLQVRNIIFLHEDSATNQSGFIYGGTTGKFSVPAGRRADFFAEGGGGVMGYWFFGLGVGNWIVGNGSPGSWYLSVSAGGAGISTSRKVTTTYNYGGTPYTSTYTDDYSVAGPMVSVGLARRFEF
jgi:hypothetical protein